VLEYDLVRQLREEMNSFPVMAGVWDPKFIGESQHETATYVAHAPDATCQQKLDLLRQNIRDFKSQQDVKGHTTVIWSASVEVPSDLDFETADELLHAIEANHPQVRVTHMLACLHRGDCGVAKVSPSVLYATAALLEGCSFVNGGSQNTLTKGLVALAQRMICDPSSKGYGYVLGTDFKAGQTKFKTCAVEYIRKLGLKPVVIASSNHLGNNDMLNLTSANTLRAKMRVKSDIFGPWEEEIDHQVMQRICVCCCAYISSVLWGRFVSCILLSSAMISGTLWSTQV
jgi:myo-inositol-1-phosphate synthase